MKWSLSKVALWVLVGDASIQRTMNFFLEKKFYLYLVDDEQKNIR
jgi:hypothetical protein